MPSECNMSWKSYILVYLALQALGVSVNATCPTFSSASNSTVRCDPSCLQLTNSKNYVVFGTEDYSGSSLVCLAALHAGVVGLQGGQVHFTRGNVTEIIGTTNNRIVSNSADPEVAFRFVRKEDPEVLKEQDLAGDMVVVHNSYHDNKLHLSCLSYDSGIELARWNYRPLLNSVSRFGTQIIKPNESCIFPFTYQNKTYWDCTSEEKSKCWCGTSENPHSWTDCSKEEGPRGLHYQGERENNFRAFRCLGSSPATDVLAIIQIPDQLYKAESSTIRASRGDHLQIELQKASGQENDVFFRRLPDSFKYTSGDFPDVSLPLTLNPVKSGDSGIYIVGSDGTKKWSADTRTIVERRGAYFHVMVRECEAGRFGWRCESWCPDCQNGGVCHPRTGTCLCPPGFTGPTCRKSCPRGRFGSRCQLRCIRDTLGFVPPEEGSCKHLTFCLPDPFGCSCAPGFAGPTCSDEPGPPSKLFYEASESALIISLHVMEKPGGVLLSCTVELQGIQASCVVPLLKTAQGPLVCELHGLEQGHRYTAKGYCCNLVGCGPALETAMATLPLPPTFSGALTVLEKSDTNITIALPSVQNAGDGDSSLIVMVQHIPKDGEVAKVNFTETYLKSAKTGSRSLRRRRQSEGACINPDDIYVAGVSRGEERRFVIGKGGSEGDYDNCPLTPGDSYRIAIVAEVDLEGRKSYAEMSLAYPVVMAGDETFVLVIVLSLIVVLVAVTVVIFLIKRRSSYCHKDDQMLTGETPRIRTEHTSQLNIEEGKFRLLELELASARTSNIVDFSGNSEDVGAHYENLPPMLNSTHFQSPSSDGAEGRDYATIENVYDELKDIVSKPILRQELESRLNCMITSPEVLTEWKAIPLCMEKSKADGETLRAKGLIPPHESLPYDENRVKLYSSNKSPLKDFINASYVHGFRDCWRYIVAVSPKYDQPSSPANFWQMVCEQRMDAIIMLDDSGEREEDSVLYFRPGAVQHYNGFFVNASKCDRKQHFKITTVKVHKSETYHKTKHYHFWKWPKEGVPRDPLSMALMLKEIIANHPVGGILVHSPQGPERTGTVLMSLLLHEMLASQGNIDPAKVLRHIRAHRAGLVESQEQLRFSLAVFDELVHGVETAVPADQLARAETAAEHGRQVLFQRAMTLLSGLTFYSASLVEVRTLNRSPAILPSDSQLGMLNPQGLSSRYLNAVLVSGLTESTQMVAMEHPQQETLARFWRFLVESKCHMLVVINTYEAADKDDFPALFPVDNYDAMVGDYCISLLDTVTGEMMKKFILEISSTKVNHKLTVYQIQGWPHDHPCPPSPTILANVADLVLRDTRAPRPTVLCCADGALGCGLVAGAVLLAERLLLTREVDVYRTVVRLKRCRPHFINSQCQFDFLYDTATALIEAQDSYLNFLA